MACPIKLMRRCYRGWHLLAGRPARFAKSQRRWSVPVLARACPTAGSSASGRLGVPPKLSARTNGDPLSLHGMLCRGASLRAR
ncbi:hypothetical protein Micbo1qcDRAFT_167508, partial [Microdochium bolleyi]